MWRGRRASSVESQPWFQWASVDGSGFSVQAATGRDGRLGKTQGPRDRSAVWRGRGCRYRYRYSCRSVQFSSVCLVFARTWSHEVRYCTSASRNVQRKAGDCPPRVLISTYLLFPLCLPYSTTMALLLYSNAAFLKTVHVTDRSTRGGQARRCTVSEEGKTSSTANDVGARRPPCWKFWMIGAWIFQRLGAQSPEPRTTAPAAAQTRSRSLPEGSFLRQT